MAKTDDQMTQDVLAELAWDPAVTGADLTVSTNDGRISLHGTADTYGTKRENVNWHYQRDAAEEDAAMIKGVQSIDDEITVNQQGASVTDITAGIAAAFARNAELYDDGITITTDGSHVTLSGTVATWSEYEMAEDIAWMSPGVTSVTNDIAVLFP